MDTKKFTNKPAPTLRELYPELNKEQLKQAEENMLQYIELSLRMYKRIRSDPKAYAQFKALTSSGGKPKIDSKESNLP